MPTIGEMLQKRLGKPKAEEFMKARVHSPQAFQEAQKAKMLARGHPLFKAAEKRRKGEGVAPRTSQPQVQKGKRPGSASQALLRTGKLQRGNFSRARRRGIVR